MKTRHKLMWLVFAGITLIGIYLPHEGSMNRRYIHELNQRAQLKAIGDGLEMFKNDYSEYPESGALDPTGENYCGAMKLAEAMMGRDLLGFHPRSRFCLDGTNGLNDTRLYIPILQALLVENLKERKDTYIRADFANAYRLRNLYTSQGIFADVNDMYMLFDVFKRNNNLLGRGEIKVGTPILYYKAQQHKSSHDLNDPDNPDNIYDYKDNHDLLALGAPGIHRIQHPLYQNPHLFYKRTQNKAIQEKPTPYRRDSFILWSAGHDGLFGTKDDITNFDSRKKSQKAQKKE
jgi:hypothetical protein